MTSTASPATTAPTGLEQVRRRVHDLMPRAVGDLTELVAIPSVADERHYPPHECLRAAEWVRNAFRAAGITDVALHPTTDGGTAVVGRCPAPPGAPTVLLYSHYDVLPPQDHRTWRTEPFELTEREGRLHGRGAADCKGNIVTQLTALRALGGGDFPVGVTVVSEGSHERGAGGLEALVLTRPELLRADVVLVCDAGSFAAGEPSVTTTLRGLVEVVVTVETLEREVHAGNVGGPAPDALAALVRVLASLHDDHGNTTVTGLDHARTWPGGSYPVDQFRADAHVLAGVELTGSGTVADLLWARPAITVLGIDCPPVDGSAAVVQPRASARLSLRVPPGTDVGAARAALVAHLETAAPWHARVTVVPGAHEEPFRARTDGPAYDVLGSAMHDAYGKPMGQVGHGGSIPLCNVLADTYPDAEIALVGVADPQSLIHEPNESVDPSEIERMALVLTLFLQRYAAKRDA